MIDNLIFKPLIPFETMAILSLIMLFFVIISRKNIINRILTIIVVLIISQRPCLELENPDERSIQADNFDILFIVDRTISMNTVDMNGETRLNVAKNDCKKIMDFFKDAYFTVIVYDKYPESKYPLTKETDIIKRIFNDIDVVSPNYVTNSPSLNVPFEEIQNYLKSKKRDEDAVRIVFFVSDGEIKSNDSKDLDFSNYSNIANLINDGAVLGYGTEQGDKIKINQKLWLVSEEESVYIDENRYLKGSNGLATTKYNESNLKKLSSNIGLDYFHVTDSSVIQEKLNAIEKKYKGEVNLITKDLVYYFFYVLLALLFIELFYYRSLKK